jgi:hypothetical protein
VTAGRRAVRQPAGRQPAAGRPAARWPIFGRWAGGVLLLLTLARVAGAEALTLERPEMAGISGFRAFWDRPVVVRGDGATVPRDQGPYGGGRVADWTTGGPGAPVFDAIHRSLPIRFPDAAEAARSDGWSW